MHEIDSMINTESSSRKLELLAIMASYEQPNEGYTREIMFASFDSNLLDAVVTTPEFSTLKVTPLRILPELQEDHRDCPWIKLMAFRQGNLKASRKQVAPLLEVCINSIFSH